MICENGRVVSLEKGLAWVETIQKGSCQSCSAKSGCGQGLLNSVFAGKRHYVKVDTSNFTQTLHIHDEVEIEIPENIMLFGSFWVYILPLLMLILGAFIGDRFFVALPGELGAISGSILGFMLASLMLKLHSIRNSHNAAYFPTIRRIISSSEPVVVKTL